MDSETLFVEWNKVLNEITTHPDLDSSQASAFLARLYPQAMSDGYIMLTAENDFLRNWIERNYKEHIERALKNIYEVEFTVDIEVNAAQAAMPPQIKPQTGQQQTPVVSQPVVQQTAYPEQKVVPESNNTNDIFATQFTQPVAVPIVNAPVQYLESTETITQVPQQSVELNPIIPQQINSINNKPVNETNSVISSLTFESFVIGASNRMAYSMAVSVAENPGHAPGLNPLFIYGKSGLGKTHLLRAIQNSINETHPELITIYEDSEEFLNEFTMAATAHSKEKSSFINFKTKYEDADVLLIDDVQYFQGKKQTLNIVFQIFNKLMSQGKQIILSADRAPKNIDIDERYHTRFSQGGTIDIQPPEIETKLGIIRSFIEEYKYSEPNGLPIDIPYDIQEYIAENSSSNIRELKSAVTQVIYQITVFKKTSLTVDDVQTILEKHFTCSSTRELTVNEIQGTVGSYYKVSHSDLVGKKRTRNIVHARHVAVYLCRQMIDLPYEYIGTAFGNRDHTTMMHADKSISQKLKENRELQEEIENIKTILKEN